MNNPENHPIIVLGVERSGTSVVAEMAHRWGAYAGPAEKLHQADAHAPRGYWEFLPLWDLLAELGNFDAGATWWDRDFQHRIEKKTADPTSRKKAIELMAEMHKEGPWFWKDPALSHFLPFWKQIWGDAIYIITVRHPFDTAVSPNVCSKILKICKISLSFSIVTGLRSCECHVPSVSFTGRKEF